MVILQKQTFALAGNPNSGKSTLFNTITGSHQHVGNYPGITVEQKEGFLHTDTDEILRIIDLPGTYSLTAYTEEEKVARMVLLNEHPDVVINVLNANALERNLYLTVQLLEMGMPLVLALNMMDEVESHGLSINIKKLSSKMGLPVVPTVARTGKGCKRLILEACHLADARRGVEKKPLLISYGPDLDPVIKFMEEKIQEAEFTIKNTPARWIALKFLEMDEELIEKTRQLNLNLSKQLEEKVTEVTAHLHATFDTCPEAVIADYRYGYISAVLREGVLIQQDPVRYRIKLSDKLDTVLTHKFFGPVFMFFILYAIYHFTFTLGAIPMGWVASLFSFLRTQAGLLLPSGLLKSLVISGIIDGVGGVMSFIPLILLIFLQIAVLEDSGYMARMAYMLDRVFRFFGLHGCSVVPFIIGGGIAGGCAVPGVLAARTLRSPREKLATLLVIPFMSCGAKLPVFILFAGVFFPGHEASIMFGLTLAGWGIALLTAKLFRSTIIRGPSTPFVMELPPYRLPLLKGLFIHTYERTWSYLKKAGTTILLISILFWAAMTYPELSKDRLAIYSKKEEVIQTEIKLTQAKGGDISSLQDSLQDVKKQVGEESLRNSLAGRVGLFLEPITEIAGFNWQMDIALLGGFVAKEIIIATLGTAYSLGDVDPQDAKPLAEQLHQDKSWTSASALALLVFVLLYAPCLVTLVTIRQETGSWGWPIFSMIFNTLLAFILAVIVRYVSLLFL